MIRVGVAGASGRLGAPVCAGVQAADDLELVARVAPSLAGSAPDAHGTLQPALAVAGMDVLVDVTRPELVGPHIRLAVDAGVPVVLGTTGFGDAVAGELDGLARERGVPVFYAPNFAITAVLMMRLATEVARHVPDCEIVEEHAATKVDRPSGTALHTARLIAGVTGTEPPIHSLRLPGPRGQPVGHLRRAGPDARDPPRDDGPRGLRARRAAGRAARARAAARPHGRARRCCL